MIEIMQKKHIREVARIHYESLPQDFLPRFGIKFLEKIFYPGVLKSPFGTTFVEIVDNKVAGFLTLAYKNNLFLKKIIFTNPQWLVLLSLKKLFSNPLFLKEGFDILLHSLIKERNDYGELPESVILAVKKEFRGRGIAKKLIDHGKKHLKSLGLNKFMVKVLNSNIITIKLYIKMGGEIQKEIVRANKKYKILTCRF